MTEIKMEALRTFAGTEGFVRRGQQFFASTESRAYYLESVNLAKRIEEESRPLDEPEQVVQPPPRGQVRLIEPVTEPEIIENPQARPSFKEAVHHVGGGWYELPDGERINGKEAAQAAYEGMDCNG